MALKCAEVPLRNSLTLTVTDCYQEVMYVTSADLSDLRVELTELTFRANVLSAVPK